MDTMNKLVERTSHIALGAAPAPGASIPHAAVSEESVVAFSPEMKAYLAQIYMSLKASPLSKEDFHEKIEGEDRVNADPLASPEDFQAYMTSPASAALQHKKKRDFSHPITDYFISSSHNTYLTGNQLYSDATASAYSSVCLLILVSFPFRARVLSLVASRLTRGPRYLHI